MSSLSNTRLRKSLRQVKKPQTGWLDVFPAVVGKADGTASTGVAGEIWVRNILNGQSLKVHNSIVPNISSPEGPLQVWVGRRVDELNIWQVIKARKSFPVPSDSGLASFHFAQHVFPAADSGLLPRKQIRELTVLVADAANFIVQVYGGQFRSSTGNKLVDSQQIDLSSYIPTVGAVYVNIETDVDGVLTIHEGTAFGAKELATAADIPVPVAGQRRVATVILFESQAELLNEHILVPMPLEADLAGLDTGSQINNADEGTPLNPDKFGFWSVADEMLEYITWEDLVALLSGSLPLIGQYRQFVYELSGDDVDIATEDGDAVFELEDLE